MTQQSLSIKAIAEICQARALEFRRQAAHERKTAFGSAKDHDKALEFEAKAQALEQLASDLIAGRLSESPVEQTAEIDDLARQIAPEAHANYDAMLLRLRNQGSDDGHAIRAANAVYGAELEAAQEIARKSIANASSQLSDEDQGYDCGFLAAAEWHDQKAIEAEMLADREPVADRKLKFRKRAERHRLYSRLLRKDLEKLREGRRNAIIEGLRQSVQQPELPLGEGGIPIEVQLAFLKKGDLPGEAFD
jgi:hypothetical protein